MDLGIETSFRSALKTGAQREGLTADRVARMLGKREPGWIDLAAHPFLASLPEAMSTSMGDALVRYFRAVASALDPADTAIVVELLALDDTKPASLLEDRRRRAYEIWRRAFEDANPSEAVAIKQASFRSKPEREIFDRFAIALDNPTEGVFVALDLPLLTRRLARPPGRARPPKPRLTEGTDWEGLATAILSAPEVDFFGVLPRPLLQGLRECLQAPDSFVSLPSVRYFTPLPETIFAERSDPDGDRRVHDWHVGLTGLRNLMRAGTHPTDWSDLITPAGYHSFLFGIRDCFTDCAICLRNAHGDATWRFLVPMPGLRPARRADLISLTPADESEGVADQVAELAEAATPLLLREVVCKPIPAAPSDPECDPERLQVVLDGFAPYGDTRPRGELLKPVAVVVVRCRYPAGLETVLKLRSPLTDNDDFDRLSLLSSRVQESDLALALGQGVGSTMNSDAEAFEALWEAAGSPLPFVLPIASFLSAAQRELSITCGLEIAPERVVFRGFHVVGHEGSPAQLGFAVHTVDLHADEMRSALANNPEGLTRVKAANVYSSGLPLNRLLRSREDWLSKHCFEIANPTELARSSA